MKKLFFAMFLLISSGAFAQISPAIADSATKKSVISPKFDFIEMNNNKLWVIDGDKKTELTNTLTLINETTIKKTGIVKWKNGKTYKLMEGDKIKMDGSLLKSKAKS